jgi:hypothetical protein
MRDGYVRRPYGGSIISSERRPYELKRVAASRRRFGGQTWAEKLANHFDCPVAHGQSGVRLRGRAATASRSYRDTPSLSEPMPEGFGRCVLGGSWPAFGGGRLGIRAQRRCSSAKLLCSANSCRDEHLGARLQMERPTAPEGAVLASTVATQPACRRTALQTRLRRDTIHSAMRRALGHTCRTNGISSRILAPNPRILTDFGRNCPSQTARLPQLNTGG